jgi:hypothetical protein
MQFEIFDCSEKMEQYVIDVNWVEPPYDMDHASSVYPFDTLRYRKSFAVMFTQTNEGALRKAVTHHNKKYKARNIPKRFKMITHRESGCWEVGRIL